MPLYESIFVVRPTLSDEETGKVVEKMFGRPCDDVHARDFLACVKSRKRSKADIEIAHAGCAVRDETAPGPHRR